MALEELLLIAAINAASLPTYGCIGILSEIQDESVFFLRPIIFITFLAIEIDFSSTVVLETVPLLLFYFSAAAISDNCDASSTYF